MKISLLMIINDIIMISWGSKVGTLPPCWDLLTWVGLGTLIRILLAMYYDCSERKQGCLKPTQAIVFRIPFLQFPWMEQSSQMGSAYQCNKFCLCHVASFLHHSWSRAIPKVGRPRLATFCPILLQTIVVSCKLSKLHATLSLSIMTVSVDLF